MPRRNDLKKILLIGSGPIVIGQACEFDYSGAQGAKALREEGYEVVLVNSNPATIMTDPELSDRTYIEPLTPEVLKAIIERERPDAILPTLGGQTALNLALSLKETGVLDEFGCELIGATVETIRKAEERELFKAAMDKIGLDSARAFTVRTVEDAKVAAKEIGFPVILRPSLTMGGSGGGVAYNDDEFDTAIRWAFSQSPVHECLVEESLIGWKEYELEVIRDVANNFIVVCTIENIDPMGVHTGDSVTVAPAMTLTDREYQKMRNAGKKIIEEIGVETGGSNIQFAVNPKDGRLIVIEMNPRVSRSSALASKATGYPIAKIAAKLAVGYRLDELENDITKTSAAFEPVIDYVVTKWPRFAFEKFAGSDPRLTTQMKSVGEAMGIGRTFKESFMKAAQSLELGYSGLASRIEALDYLELADNIRALEEGGEAPLLTTAGGSVVSTAEERAELRSACLSLLSTPLPNRFWTLFDALRLGASVEEVCRATRMDLWFVREFDKLVKLEKEGARACSELAGLGEKSMEQSARLGVANDKTRALIAALTSAKQAGFSDDELADASAKSGLFGDAFAAVTSDQIANLRSAIGLHRVYYRVDTCAAEFEAHTPYLYSSWGVASEADPSSKRKVMILGGGPNRIGQGIEFDYCCVHAAFAMRDLGVESIMVNCNPETVSTDYDTSDRLYFEPLTFEHVMSIVREEKPDGVIVQFGGQTPLRLAVALEEAGVPIWGTSADAIDLAEDRERFDALLEELGLERPQGGIAKGVDDAFEVAKSIGYPVVVRPSYVLGGRAMEIVHSERQLADYMKRAIEALEGSRSQNILVDEFLRDAMEVDVDAICDGTEVIVGGILQHVEEAGVHSGDSSMVLPPHALVPDVLAKIRAATRALGLRLGVIGLMNIQFAIRGSRVFVIEVNPRASRTVPFISKATGVPLAQLAAKVMAGKTLLELGLTESPVMKHVAVKESVFPFNKFPGVDTVLGPEMRSTGEVMGIADSFKEAFDKALEGSFQLVAREGQVLFSVGKGDVAVASELATRLSKLGYEIVTTDESGGAFARLEPRVVAAPGQVRPNVIDALKSQEFCAVIHTRSANTSNDAGLSLRRQTLLSGTPFFSTMAAASALVESLEVRAAFGNIRRVKSLQEYTA